MSNAAPERSTRYSIIEKPSSRTRRRVIARGSSSPSTTKVALVIRTTKVAPVELAPTVVVDPPIEMAPVIVPMAPTRPIHATGLFEMLDPEEPVVEPAPMFESQPTRRFSYDQMSDLGLIAQPPYDASMRTGQLPLIELPDVEPIVDEIEDYPRHTFGRGFWLGLAAGTFAMAAVFAGLAVVTS